MKAYVTVYYLFHIFYITLNSESNCAEKEVGRGGRKLVIFDQTDGNIRYWCWGKEGGRQRGPRKIHLLADGLGWGWPSGQISLTVCFVRPAS